MIHRWRRDPKAKLCRRAFALRRGPSSKRLQQQGSDADVALALEAPARPALSVLDQKIELLPHDLVGIRRRDHSRFHNQSNHPGRIGAFGCDLWWAHRTNLRVLYSAPKGLSPISPRTDVSRSTVIFPLATNCGFCQSDFDPERQRSVRRYGPPGTRRNGMIRGKMPHPCGRCGRLSRGVFVQIVLWRHLVLMSLFRREHVSSRKTGGS
jgi:hypothetical protein